LVPIFSSQYFCMENKKIFPFLAGLIFSLHVQKAHASGYRDSVPKMDLHYMISLNGNYTRNSVEQIMISTNNYLILKRGKIGFTQALNYQYSVLKSPISAPGRNLLNELQMNSKIHINTGKMEPLIIIGYEKSKYRSIINRYFAILGVDYKLVSTKLNHFSVILGPSAEAASYTDGTDYDHLFACLGLRGMHELDKNKSKLNIHYNTYFFRRFNENRWRYQGVVTAMYQVLKPVYVTVNMNFSEEKINKLDFYRKNTGISFGLTYRM